MAYNIEFRFPGTPITVPLAADTIVATSETRFASVCPHCETPTKINQVSICPNHPDHGPFGRDQLAKARPIGKGKNTVLVPFTSDEVNSVGTPIPKEMTGKADLHAHPTDQVAAAGMRPGPKQYWLQLQHKTTTTTGYGALMAAVRDPKITWITHLRIGQSVALYKLAVTSEGDLTMVELIHPERVKAAPVIEYDEGLAAKQGDQIRTLVDVEDFDADTYADSSLAEINALAETKIAAGQMTVVPADPDEGPPSGGDMDDLTALLEASLKARRGEHPSESETTPARVAEAV